MQVVVQDAIENDHENGGQDSVWNTNTMVTYAVKEGTHLTGRGAKKLQSAWITK